MKLHTQLKKFLLCISFILISLNAESHTKSESYSNWTIGKSNVISIITIPLHEVTRLPYIENKDVTFEEAFQMLLRMVFPTVKKFLYKPRNQ